MTYRLLAILMLAGLVFPMAGIALARPPAQTGFAHVSFQRVWERTDSLVVAGGASRTWFWGPKANTGAMTEPHKESPGGTRLVQYFDKSRMEINNPDANPNDPA